MSLKPILVSSLGRSGSTALMALLASDPRIAFERVHPFEHRYLEYFIRFAALLESGGAATGSSEEGIRALENQRENPDVGWGAPQSAGFDYLAALWGAFCAQTTSRNANARFYAEKVHALVAAVMRQRFDTHALYLFRDPRDLFLSSNAFMRSQNRFGFARLPTDSAIDYARTLVCEYLYLFESYYMDRNRSDCTLVRYEDFIGNTRAFCEFLEQKLGVQVNPGPMASSFENHRTAETLETTLFRWRREAFPPGVERLLVEHLRPEMARLGYAVPATDGYRLRSIEFAAGRVDLSPIEFSSDGILELREDYAVVKIQGGDFWMALEPDPFEAGEVGAVVAALSSVVGESCSLYWRNPGNQFSEERVLHLPIKPAFGWGVMRFRVAEHPEWKGTIAQLRLDLFNGVNPRGEGYIRWVRLIA